MSQVSARLRAGFGVGDIASISAIASMGAFLLFYYTQVLGLDGALTGLALGIAILWDAVSDPLVGAISDRWRSRLGRRHPFMWASAFPAALSFYLLFSPPEGLSATSLFLWLLVTSILTRTFLTLYTIPHLALAGELATEHAERTRLVNVSSAMSSIGTAVFMGIAYLLLFAKTPEFENGLLNRQAYVHLGLLGAAVIAFCITVSAASTQRAALRLKAVPLPEEKLGLAPLYRDLRQTMTNGNFRILMFGVLVAGLLGGVFGATYVHLMTYFWGILPADMAYVTVVGLLGSIIVFRFVHTHLARAEKKGVLIWASVTMAVAPAIGIGLRLLGWLPENGSMWVYGVVATYFMIYTASMSVKGTISRSMIADIVDENELESGVRQEGSFFSANFFVMKATAGLGPAVGGVILTLIDFPADATTTVPADALFKLGLIVGPVFGLLFLIPVAAYAFYGLDKQRVAEIREQLEERGAGEGLPERVSAPARAAQ